MGGTEVIARNLPIPGKRECLREVCGCLSDRITIQGAQIERATDGSEDFTGTETVLTIRWHKGEHCTVQSHRCGAKLLSNSRSRQKQNTE